MPEPSDGRWGSESAEPLKRTLLLPILSSPLSKLSFLPPSASLPTNKTRGFANVWSCGWVPVPPSFHWLILRPSAPLPFLSSGSLEPANADNKNEKEGKLSPGSLTG